ncbi:ictacalcin-like [Acanthochromis polyacanthus]|uniref:ictacalcin-like n=1 Tax=Acanthochromis polyacanthus TaxID=80966 RepID=UPI0022349414|nr:ictacalcin-like [Acanthochromis polyacanthus]
MSDILTAMNLLIKVFEKYSGKEGDKTTLTKGELKELLQHEMGPLLGKAPDKAAVDKIFKDLDSNSDGLVDFTEYVTLICCLTTVCHEALCKK